MEENIKKQNRKGITTYNTLDFKTKRTENNKRYCCFYEKNKTNKSFCNNIINKAQISTIKKKKNQHSIQSLKLLKNLSFITNLPTMTFLSQQHGLDTLSDLLPIVRITLMLLLAFFGLAKCYKENMRKTVHQFIAQSMFILLALFVRITIKGGIYYLVFINHLINKK